jgi:hypothetical protein
MAIALRIRRLWVALAAIAASLPATAGAATNGRCEAMPAGCTACCCGDDASAPSRTTDSAIVAPTPSSRGIVVSRPASTSCECRGQDPTAPAQKPGQRVEERRVETGREIAADSPTLMRPRASLAIAFMPDVGPPRSPIYLRTLRLLI